MRRIFHTCSLITILLLLSACGAKATPSTPAPATLPSAPTAQTKVTLPAQLPTAPTALFAPSTAVATASALTSSGPVRGGELREAVAQDAVSFHPYQTTDPISALFQDNVYASHLWRRDPQTLDPVPNMAESWTVSPDYKTYTFRLRPNLKWSDGEFLTAFDFQWTFDQASKSENKYPYLDNLREIASYRAIDNWTLQVVLKQSSCVGLTTADAIVPLPKHTWEKLDWSDPAKNPEIQNPTVVSGLYKLKEWVKGDHATFVRKNIYFRDAANVDAYTIFVVPDAATRLKMLQSEQVDKAPVDIADYAAMKKVSTLQEYRWDPADVAWDYIGFNLRRPFLQDVEVRHALSYAIPRQTIADQVFQGLAKPIFSAVAPTNWAYNADVPRYDYNLDTAQATLRRAGYKADAGGRLLDKQGKLVKLVIVFNDDNPQYAQIAQIAHDQLAKLGIDSDLSGMDFTSLLDYLKKRPSDFDLYVLGWRTPSEPYFLYQVWSQQNIPDLNPGGYVNAQIEKLYDQTRRPPCDMQVRQKVFQQIQGILTNDSPYIFLTYRTGYAFLNRRVVANPPSRLGIDYLPEQWYIR